MYIYVNSICLKWVRGKKKKIILINRELIQKGCMMKNYGGWIDIYL